MDRLRAEEVDAVGRVLDEIGGELGLDQTAQAQFGPGAGDHAVHGTKLQRLVDIVQ